MSGPIETARPARQGMQSDLQHGTLQMAFVGHDAGHNAITHDRWSDGILGLLVTSTVGIGISWYDKDGTVRSEDTTNFTAERMPKHCSISIVDGGTQDLTRALK